MSADREGALSLVHAAQQPLTAGERKRRMRPLSITERTPSVDSTTVSAARRGSQ